MDWRHNQWVGVLAAVLVIVGIVGIFYWVSRPTVASEHGGYTFLCESTGNTFKIADADMEKEAVYMKYFGKDEQGVECKLCGKTDAYHSYYCPTCQKWYHYQRTLGASDSLACPQGHEIEEQYR